MLAERPRIVHVRDRVPGALYIGRGNQRYGLAASPYANPYKIGRDGTRDEVLIKYKAWLIGQPLLVARAQHEIPGCPAVSCWCAPLPCHGRPLIEVAYGEV